METDKNKTYVFTLDCEMVALKSKQEYYVGQQISFQKSDLFRGSNIINFPNSKNLKIITSIAAIFIFALLIAGGAFFLGRETTATFDENVTALVSVDINPSIEFEINKDDKIISVNCFNEEGQEIIDSLDFRGMVLQAGIDEVVSAAKELGYINEDVNIVLVSGTLYGNDGNNSYASQLKKVLEGLQGTSDNASIMAVYVEDSNVFDLAQENDISIGKALLYQYAVNQGLNVSLSDIKNSSITQLLTLLDLQVANLEVGTQTPTETSTTVQPTTQSTTQPSNGNTTPSGGTNGLSPNLDAYVAGNTIYFGWTTLSGTSVNYNGKTYSGFKFYKVAYDQYDSTPTYPENAYLTYISNYSQGSYSFTPSAGCDLSSGTTYYYAITYVFDNGSFTTNTRQLTTPTYTTPTPTSFAPTFNVTQIENGVTLSWTSSPSEYVSNGGNTYSDFYYYKTVKSESISQPKYPEQGYMDAISNMSTSSATYRTTDYDSELISGHTYYFGLTYVYNNGKIYTYWSTPVTIP